MQAGHALADLHRRHGTDLRYGVGVDSFVEDAQVSGVRRTDGTILKVDLVVGASPATNSPCDSGLTINDGIACDQWLRSTPEVWAAGDTARWHNPDLDVPLRVGH